jgi:hypothetical protein
MIPVNLREVSMQRLVIHVKDDAKLNALMSVLNEINFIEVEIEEKGASGLSRHGDLRKLFGIWENRDISLADIRSDHPASATPCTDVEAVPD